MRKQDREKETKQNAKPTKPHACRVTGLSYREGMWIMSPSTHLSLGRGYLRGMDRAGNSRSPCAQAKHLPEVALWRRMESRYWEKKQTGSWGVWKWEGNLERQRGMDTTIARRKFQGYGLSIYCVQDHAAYFGENRSPQTPRLSSVTDVCSLNTSNQP